MRILAPSSGQEAAAEIANYVINIAKRLDATLIALHILSDGESEEDGRNCCDVLYKAAKDSGVNVETQIAQGDVVQSIIDAAERQRADLVVMGASNGKVVKRWLSADVMHRSETPVLVVPHCYGQ